MNRGDIWIVNLEPGFGREIHKKRPCLIISSQKVNQKTHNKIIIPSTSQVPQHIGEEMIEVGKKEGLDKKSVLLPIFIRSIDQERLVKKIGKISDEKLYEVEQVLKLIVGIEEEMEN